MVLQEKLERLPKMDRGDLNANNAKVVQTGDAIQHHGGIGVVDGLGKRDWHDWEAIAKEEQRTGG